MYLHTLSASLIGDQLYFTSFDFNALFVMDIITGHINYKTYFKKFDKYRKDLYGKQIILKDKIYFIPRRCDKLAIFNIKTEEIEYITLKEKGDNVIRDAFIEGDYLWLLYSQYPCNIFKINLQSNRYYIINIDWEKATVFDHNADKQLDFNNFLIVAAWRVNDSWWMIEQNNGYLIDYRWKNNFIKIYCPECFKEQNIAGTVIHKHVWKMTGNENKIFEHMWKMTEDESRIFEYDYNYKLKKMICLPEINQIMGKVRAILEHDNYLLVAKDGGIVSINKKDNSVKKLVYSSKKILLTYVEYLNTLIILPAQGEGGVVFNLLDNEMKEFEFVWNVPLTNDSLEDFFSNCLDECVCGLRKFVELEPNESANRELFCGEKIWNSL